MKKILFIDNTAHHLFGQLHLMAAFRDNGYIVEALIPNDENYYRKIEQFGISCHQIQIDGKGVNPFKDYSLIQEFKNLFLRLKPDLICSYTIKPNLYAAIAAKRYRIPLIAGVTGLGTAFLSKNLLNQIVVRLYKFAFKRIGCVFFQNNDDKNTFEQLKIIPNSAISFALPGDGVDLAKFKYVGLTKCINTTFIFSGRLLWDKGLGELVAAIKIVKQKYPATQLKVIGNYFLANPSGVSEKQIKQWEEEGFFEYLGMVDNVFEVMTSVDCMVLPSYYKEGLPRVLMEACSMGKPIITVDNVGCREVIEDGVNGFMAKPRDVDSLASAMISFIQLPFDKKVEMGLQGRRKMEREFDQTIVVNKYLEVAKQLLNK